MFGWANAAVKGDLQLNNTTEIFLNKPLTNHVIKIAKLILQYGNI